MNSRTPNSCYRERSIRLRPVGFLPQSPLRRPMQSSRVKPMSTRSSSTQRRRIAVLSNLVALTGVRLGRAILNADKLIQN